ncbi:hypothetical protein [Paracoccus sp. SSK6]|uniref:hypothetical protein n=1 Tax=Paracoccus sp. SSK6 TaxID=3143131 RepID=UPI003218E28A
MAHLASCDHCSAASRWCAMPRTPFWQADFRRLPWWRIQKSPAGPYSALLFPMVLGLTGDKGASKLLQSLPNLKRISVSQEFLTDIDYAADLSAT